ncbi:MAG: 2'-5' RNA ligase family protein [Anditalea sp.]
MAYLERLEKHYHLLLEESLQKIKENGFGYDSLIDSEKDDRFGITLLIRPSLEVKTSVKDFIDKVKKIEPVHHFYSNSDIHVTVMPIISCYEGFQLDQIHPQDYIDLLSDCLDDIPSFEVLFRGVTVSPSCIMIKGFPSDDTLEQVRDRLRGVFKNSPLEQSLDRRYPLKTAHSTVIRFKKRVKHPKEILAQINHFRNYDFGKFPVDKMELVVNDWYQREEKVKRLFSFGIG